MKIRSVGTGLFHVDRETDRPTHITKLTVALRNFVNAPKNVMTCINPLNAELNPICHLLVLVGPQHILHVSRVRVNVPLLPY